MELLKKLFPLSFSTKDVSSLIIKTIIYVVAGAVFGILIGIFSKIPVIKIIFAILGALVNIYVIAGIVILFLDYFKVIK